MKKLVIFSFIFLSLVDVVSARSTRGREFWVGFMENLAAPFNGPPSFRLHLVSRTLTSCTVSVPGTGYAAVIPLIPYQVTIFTLPQGNYNPFGDEAFANNGLRIVSSDSIEVRAFHHRVFFTESSIILPIHELGTDYMPIVQNDGLNNSPAEFMVLATQNNTTVEIIPSAITVGTRPANVAFTVAMQAGQMSQLQSFYDFSGTSIRSLDNKKIAVFSGARQAAVCGSGADDHIYDQVYPLNSLGNRYHMVPFLYHYGDVIKIVGTQNGTTLTINNSPAMTLSKGQAMAMTLNVPTEVISNFPLLVGQIATSQGCNGGNSGVGDPGMITLVQNTLTLYRSVFSLPSGFSKHGVNVVVKAGAEPALRLDNTPLSLTTFSPIGNGYVCTRIPLDTLGVMQHTLSCDSGFNAVNYGFDYYNFYGHHLGFEDPPPRTATVNVTGMGNLIHSQRSQIHPNPASGNLTLQSELLVDRMELTDMSGRKVQQLLQPQRSANIDVSHLDPGLYLVKIWYQDPSETPEVIRLVKE